jgi:uncharacterized membrane protein
MMNWIEFLRWAHVIGATVLLGTGSGIAFFMVMAHSTRDARIIAHTAGVVVIADWIFTASAVVAQPITGLLLAQALGWRLTDSWLLTSIVLYVLIGAFWLPVVWIQHQMRDLARAAEGGTLPPRYFALYRIWFACGAPAFLMVLIIVWLMTARPHLF